MPDKKYVQMFEEGNRNQKDLLGGKGANLAEMTNLGIPVPPGFTITTEACIEYFGHKDRTAFMETVMKQANDHIKKVEEKSGKKFGNDENPLLFSVRSGAKFSMPGMMDTVLNLGLNDRVLHGLVKKANERTAYDSYRRLLQMFGDVVLGIDHEFFHHALDAVKAENNVNLDVELTADMLKDVVKRYKKIYKDEKKELPDAVHEQLRLAVEAVFKSWNTERAIIYRKINNIPDNLGTAVNVQAMVMGNMNDKSGSGVGFTRNPATGEKKFYGEYLLNAQGEDVVAGIRTPKPAEELAKEMPACYKELMAIADKLERHYKDVQDIEFTIENSKLYMLQCRNGKRTGKADVIIAMDMLDEKILTEEEAILQIDPNLLDQLLHNIFDEDEKKKAIKENRLLGKGLAASPGAASGKIYFTPDEVIAQAKKGKVILARPETSPDDVGGMVVCQGILTGKGGLTSHAAVVARGMGKPCVSAFEAGKFDSKAKTLIVAGKTIREGDMVSIDGSTGEVFLGEIKTSPSDIISGKKTAFSERYQRMMKIADKHRKLGVRTNADNPRDSKVARDLGAEGIGLCRTEHMFFEDRLPYMREMILADNETDRRKALAKLLPMQREDFVGMFRIMKDLPVVIRLLDPPLHEFLPHDAKEIEELSKSSGILVKKIHERSEQLKESNPMLGHRGCRLLLTYKEICEMQARAIFEAACELVKNEKLNVVPEVMIPVVAFEREVKDLRIVIEKVAADVMKVQKVKFNYTVGTMIETPRACVRADQMAKHADFFSFGTNDLTQMTGGLSRDDAGVFLAKYKEMGIISQDPFKTIDQEGVGDLIKMCVERGRKVKPAIKIGICGEQGGDPASIDFCHKAGLNYVSCSPFRVPTARLAAAQAQIKVKK